jgi:hypothetical protein
MSSKEREKESTREKQRILMEGDLVVRIKLK